MPTVWSLSAKMTVILKCGLIKLFFSVICLRNETELMLNGEYLNLLMSGKKR